MSKLENSYDNNLIQSFNKFLKTEMFDSKNIYHTRDEAKKAYIGNVKKFV
ncbi:hypothetical protein GCM10008904_21520 [Paraclostridium ghonii]|uniref:Integrase catalytic domain-containing protein n=1 Tax=Paraclostridium ghonii TaxID=29358 RepID=A0ABU0N064_9FIRM|nr:hypothetical protein [Paeniclostridium ghonii]